MNLIALLITVGLIFIMLMIGLLLNAPRFLVHLQLEIQAAIRSHTWKDLLAGAPPLTQMIHNDRDCRVRTFYLKFLPIFFRRQFFLGV